MVLLTITPAAAAEPSAVGPLPAAEIVFQGNAGLSAAALRQAAAAELADFEQRGQRRSDIDDAAFQMELAYQRGGYAFARVEYGIFRTGDRTTVAFVITEGPQVLIGDIRIIGNAAIDLETLTAFFRPETLGLFHSTQRPFVRSEMDSAVESMRDYYRGRGYLDAAIEGPSYEFTADRRRVDVLSRINEGVQYRVQHLEVPGDAPAGAGKDWEELQRTTVGQPYTSRTRLVVRARAAQIFGDRGFPDADVTVTVQADPATGAVTLALEVAAGPQVTIAGVEVRGNQRTQPDFIRERLRLKPGDRYNRSLETESFNELYRAGVFSKVEIDLEKTGEEGRRVLVVTVEEMPSQEVFFEPGYGSYEQLRLVVGYRL